MIVEEKESGSEGGETKRSQGESNKVKSTPLLDIDTIEILPKNHKIKK